jgi:tight adherence protein B
MIAALLLAAAAWVWAQPVTCPAEPTGRRGRAAWLAAVAGVVALALTLGSPVPTALVVVLAGAGWGVRHLWTRRAAARAAEQTRERVLECCEVLASELAAGQPPGSALGLAAEEWAALVPVAQTGRYGGDVPTALRRAAAAPGAEELRLLAAAWQVSHRTGQGLADALARVAETLRDARATERVVRGELASARATARLVSALPVVAWLIGSGSGGDPVGFLLTTMPGVVCLASGLALVLAGLAWIERIAAGVER